jgi:hypothetical protein
MNRTELGDRACVLRHFNFSIGGGIKLGRVLNKSVSHVRFQGKRTFEAKDGKKQFICGGHDYLPLPSVSK